MKKILLFFLLYSIVVQSTAQIQRGLKGPYKLDNYPTVSFVWNTANPNVVESSRFALFEKDSVVDFSVTVLPVDNRKSINKSILILWEDMASHNLQSDFTQELLIQFFEESRLSPTDRFEVAVFDRKKDAEGALLHPLIGHFSSNRHQLKESVSNYLKSDQLYSDYPLQSDLYLAINDGIDLLKKEPANYNGIIVVVTAGLNVKAAGASTEMETVRQNALQAGIPIYVVKYPIAGNTPEVNLLAESTYGLCSSTLEVSEALSKLQQQYQDMDRRLQGCDYEFCFTAKGKHDGEPNPMCLMVDKVRQPLPPYLAPKATLSMRLMEYWWVVLSVVVLIVICIILTALSARKRKIANRIMQEQIRREQKESEQRSREIVENLRREQEAKEREEREMAALSEKAAEQKRLSDLMYTKNLHPRLQCQAGNDTFTYTINKPCVTLGREASNDVAFTMRSDSFNNQTVSSLHAEIVFNGAAFEIINKSRSYTQGIVVNGQLYQRCILRNGDRIGLGEAVITFYL